MLYYFKSAPAGLCRRRHAAPGPTCRCSRSSRPFNAMGYDGMTLGNHEFNFGSEIFTAVLKHAKFPVLGANVTDTGAYGLAEVRRPALRGEDRRTGGDQAGDPGDHEPPGPELRAAEQHPWPVVQRPAGQGPGARDGTWTDERRRRGSDPHRVHRGPDERRGRQERRHQHGDDGDRASTRSSAPTATRTRRPGSAPTSTSRRSSTAQRRPRDHQPGLPLQQHARRGLPRLPPEGRRRLRGRQPGRPVPVASDDRRTARGPGDQGDRRSIRRCC